MSGLKNDCHNAFTGGKLTWKVACQGYFEDVLQKQNGMLGYSGDWFKVEKLVRETGGDDSQLINAWNKIGQYYSDRHKWAKAAQYYTQDYGNARNRSVQCRMLQNVLILLAPWHTKCKATVKGGFFICQCVQAKNSEMLVECFYALEDFASLEKLMQALPEGNVLLRSIGEKFQSVGLCNEGVSAFLKVKKLEPLVSGSRFTITSATILNVFALNNLQAHFSHTVIALRPLRAKIAHFLFSPTTGSRTLLPSVNAGGRQQGRY
eukprot:1158916-Pelagomonas_calceolata.AAC.8